MKTINPNIKARFLPVASGTFTKQQIRDTISGLADGRLKDFKPRRLTAKQRLALRLLGVGNEIPFVVRPETIPKMVIDDQCDLCGQVLPSETVQCFRCGTCVFCGAYSDDQYGNTCLTCGNDAPGRTDDTDITVNIDAVR